MNRFTAVFTDELTNVLFEKKSTVVSLSYASTDEYDESFVSELFTKIKKSFQNNKNPRYPKNKISIKVKGQPIKITLEVNGLGYWLCKVVSIKLKYNIISIDDLKSKQLLDKADFNINNNHIEIHSTEEFLTEYLYVSYNMVYPISENEVNTTIYTIGMKHTNFAEYISFCKSFIEIYIHVSTKYKYISLQELFLIDDSFPEIIKIKINELILILQDKINIIIEKEEKVVIEEEKNKIKYNWDLDKSKDELKESNLDFQRTIKSFHEKDDNWKVFAYAFIKICPISIV